MKPFFLALVLAVPAGAYDSIRLPDPIKTDTMGKPAGAAASPTRLFVIDQGKSSLFIYDLGGSLIKSVGSSGTGKESFRSPRGVAAGPNGRVYVADTGNSRIQVLDADGKFLSAFGSKGTQAGQFKSPQSVSVGSDGRVYVADTGNNRVQVFTNEGILLYVFGIKGNLEGQFTRPTRVAVDPSDNIYVLDSGNNRVEKFDPWARFVAQFDGGGDDLAVDRYGFQYILKAGDSKVVEKDSKGQELGKLGSQGWGPGHFKKPKGLALTVDGRLLVVDPGNHRVDILELANKLKTAPLPPNLKTTMNVTGPSRSWSVAAQSINSSGGKYYAYLPQAGQFVVLDQNGKESARFGAKTGKGPSVTRGSGGLAADEKAGLYVSDAASNRIQRFALDGTWKANFAETTGFLESAKKEGRVRGPRGVAINDQGTIYVADAGNSRVQAFNQDGVFMFSIGPERVGGIDLKEPVAVAWDNAGFIFFVDKGLKKVFKCQPSGAYIASWGEEGTGPGQFQEPSALAFDGNNYLYILDRALKRVSVYSKEGRWITDMFSSGPQDNELSDPTSLAVDGSKLLVADAGKGKILTFDLHPSLGAPAQISTSTKEGVVSLSWKAALDPWTSGYLIYRSTVMWGSYEQVGQTGKTKFQDESASADQTYYYRVATQAKTKDIGPASLPMEASLSGSINRAPVEIASVTLGNIFSANYKWYLKNRIGTAVIVNNVDQEFHGLKFTFRLKDFMDFGYDQEIKTLGPHKTVEIPLIATLNNKVLDVSEDTPVQAEFTVVYFEDGKEQTVSLTKPLRLYSRNAITWEVPERIANFVTPKDPPVLDYAREVLRQAPKDPKAEALNGNLVTAVHLWDALAESGVKFFANPSNPYEKVSEDPNFPVDYTQFPRETLKRKNGQCDDLSTLLVSMLDGTKVPAAIIDYPGHMAIMFDTQADDPSEAGLPEEDLVLHEGTYWVPLESTLVGKPFPEAVEKAAFEYRALSAKGEARIVDVRRAWETFEPATLPAKDWDAPVPDPGLRQKRFSAEVESLASERHKFLRQYYENLLKADPSDLDDRVQLGMVEFQNGSKEKAIAEFNKVLSADAHHAAALNDLGNVAFLSGDYAGAEAQYLKASQADEKDSGVWMNLVKAAAHLKNKDKAGEYGKKAVALDANLAPAVDTLIKGAQ